MLCVLPFLLSNSPAKSFLLSFRFLLLFSCPAFACSPAWLPVLSAFLPFVLLSWLCGLAFGVGWVVGFLSLSEGFRYKKKGRALRPFLRCLFALILSNINPHIFRLGFHKIPLYLHILSGCGRFLLFQPSCVPAALHPLNTGRCFRALLALLG